MEQKEENKTFNYRQSREKKKKFVRYREGAELYSMGISKFQKLAKESGAVYKVKHMCLVNTEILDKYLETFRLESDYGFYK